MKNIVAMGLACCFPIGLAAEDPSEAFLGTVNVLVMEDSAPLGRDMTFNRALLTARIEKVSALHERGRWL